MADTVLESNDRCSLRSDAQTEHLLRMIDDGLRAIELVTGSASETNAATADLSHGLLSNPLSARILVVDDEPLNIDVVRGFLEVDGYENFASTTKPEEALALVEECNPDIVLLDIQMPGMSGFDVLQAIRRSERHATLPVVILTANTDYETRIHALKLGATDFLTKPIMHAEMAARVRNMLTIKAHHDHLRSYSTELEQAVRQRTAQLEASRQDVVRCLAKAGEYRDDDTGKHVVRVGRYARLIGEQLGLTTRVLDILEPAAQLHDVGKIGIPDSILLKPGPLTDEECAAMRRHCAFGADIVEPERPGSGNRESRLEWLRERLEHGPRLTDGLASPLLEVAFRIALTHHERWDGSGYPLGLRREQIPLEGRITAVADVFDALSSHRPYKDAFPTEQCIAFLEEGRSHQFDPACLDAFLSRIDDVRRVRHELAD
ncbi:response regulator [bacterium]|nr:response regulator [bacterium]